tara:strand:+ start:11471 stop:11584 length:114 start_codon:yes stop_codon:yes gene_type:complete
MRAGDAAIPRHKGATQCAFIYTNDNKRFSSERHLIDR